MSQEIYLACDQCGHEIKREQETARLMTRLPEGWIRIGYLIRPILNADAVRNEWKDFCSLTCLERWINSPHPDSEILKVR